MTDLASMVNEQNSLIGKFNKKLDFRVKAELNVKYLS